MYSGQAARLRRLLMERLPAARQIDGEVANDGHILGAMTLSQPRLILVEDRVEGPV
jgi:hypothetical protein